ncbi:gamma-glutamyl-gamma-aminobutyrate hydrolase family protein [Mycobacterium sp. GA-2829]|uniref:gamma-glutamyl-gamma-aminobutyrate hydrolase family protein n=1 Tax=Mycobacterium sp. GA-2829 TaxID=1772283 RepID=UPI00073FF2F2|nr:gamma-glutamyl-gamma-aminobutyrate hydrolase family protein [Mycobacterium sp. GA-2829]KUI23663.1 glutamine amidotransferase [Mycobacterium sp. GA-2829]
MNETTPLIGICGVNLTARWGGSDQPAVATVHTCLQAAYRAGAQPLILPALADADPDLLLHTVDAIVLAGAADDAPLDGFEREIADAALQERVPVLGLGRGFQILNVAAGGTLHAPSSRPAEPASHTVDVVVDSLLGRCGLAGVREVHAHRSPAVARVGQGARVTAVSVPDGAAEAVEWPDHPFAFGVRWELEDSPLRNLFGALTSAATAPLFDDTPDPVTR